MALWEPVSFCSSMAVYVCTVADLTKDKRTLIWILHVQDVLGHRRVQRALVTFALFDRRQLLQKCARGFWKSRAARSRENNETLPANLQSSRLTSSHTMQPTPTNTYSSRGRLPLELVSATDPAALPSKSELRRLVVSDVSPCGGFFMMTSNAAQRIRWLTCLSKLSTALQLCYKKNRD